jgi:hypothetical protein
MVTWLDSEPLPSQFNDPDELDDFLGRPSRTLAADLAAIDGDIIVLGVGGKMGPTLARLARNAAPDKDVIGVARFTEAGVRERLEACGVETIACDLLDQAAAAALPRVRNVIFMVGRKFGARTNPALTWAMNVHVPAIVAELFRGSRIIVFSTGCVYPFVPATSEGAGTPTSHRSRQPVPWQRSDQCPGSSRAVGSRIIPATRRVGLRRVRVRSWAPPL